MTGKNSILSCGTGVKKRFSYIFKFYLLGFYIFNSNMVSLKKKRGVEKHQKWLL